RARVVPHRGRRRRRQLVHDGHPRLPNRRRRRDRITAFFYQHIEGTMGSALVGGRNIGAWIHLTLGSLGSAGASLIMAWGGFQAGAALLTTDVGGGGQNVLYVHTNLLSPLAVPIGSLLGIALLGYLVGGIVLASGWMAAHRKSKGS